MKYSQRLERESVPEWSLHNLDYNSLKHEIKVHTTRDQATAMAIPGHQDMTLRKFEDGLYMELCRQHDRLDLFVASKADEISRHLDHLSKSIHRWINRSQDQLTVDTSLKSQRKFAQYERELVRCGRDIQSLSRFANAQLVGFRKIIKKYKRWTGSTTLASRFSQNVLSDPMSFTRRDFVTLHTRYDEISFTLHASAPVVSEPSSPESIQLPSSDPAWRRYRNWHQSEFGPLPPPPLAEQAKYWNEYDDGSECGSSNYEYVIYVNPDKDTSFPGLDYVQGILKIPIEKARKWLKLNKAAERQPLLLTNGLSIGNSSIVVNNSPDVEHCASPEGYQSSGYATHYAVPGLSHQVYHYLKNVLFWGTISCFIVSFILLAIAGILFFTGKHKLHVEVDVGVTVGVVASLVSACTALGITLYRRDPLPLSYRLMVWSTFAALCLLNGMLLVLLVGKTP